MGVFEHFPYANMHEMNLDWLLKKMKELIQAMETFKATESLKFADPIIWDITTQYEKSTIVLDPTGNAYLSLKAVPAGVQLNNDEYWLEIFNFTDYTRTANQNLTVNTETNTTRATAAYQVDDWLIWNDVLYRVTAAIAIDDALIVAPDAGFNIIHFTVEDFIKAFITYANGLINQYKNDIDASELQYKNDIDASELAYRNQLAQDIADTTASLQAQLNLAISGATVDSEVINARLGVDGITYPTLGDAIRTQFLNRTIEFLHVNVSSSSDPYADFNALPVNSYITYETGEAYLLNKPDGADYWISVMTLSAYHPNYTGALQICTAFDKRTATMHPRVFTRLIWGGAGKYTYSTWNELLDDNDAVARDFTKIEASLLANDSPYLDLNTFPANRYACYLAPTQGVQNAPDENYNIFNILSFKAYPTEANTAITQLIFYPDNGHIYTRSNFGNTWYPWKRLLIDNDAILKDSTKIEASLLANDSPYLDLNTFPANRYACYLAPTQGVQNTPDERYDIFNIISFKAYPTEANTAITQLIFYPNNGHIYTRSNFGNTWYPWRRVDNADESIRRYSYHDILPVNMNINSSTKMIFSGDSITANPHGYVSNLASILGCNVVNIGVNRSCYTKDDTSTSILDKLQTQNLTCDYLVIAGGTNDYGVTQATESAFKTALTNTFNYVDNNTTGQVIIMLPINRCTTAANASGLYLSDYRQMLYEEAVRRNYWVVDCDSFFPNTSGTWQNEILPDKLHPSAVGARMYAESIATKLKY